MVYPDALLYCWGAKNAVLILEDGENWRLLSANMLHAGVIHWIGMFWFRLKWEPFSSESGAVACG